MSKSTNYQIKVIDPKDETLTKQLENLLQQEGIAKDGNLDHSIGLFDENGEMIATGSCFKNTLRDLAVRDDHRGEGHMITIVNALKEYETARGITHIFLYTKPKYEGIFESLGFHRIVLLEGKLIFMESMEGGFRAYVENLKKETRAFMETEAGKQIAASVKDKDADPAEGGLAETAGLVQSAVIMNANPFTCGHKFLLQTAASQSDLVHVFLVSEEMSLIPFEVRERLVKEGTTDIPNLVFHRTGDYIISSATFPSYFLKDQDTVITSHASLDVEVFCHIAKALGISKRFVGDEPFSHVTSMYNKIMDEGLSRAGMRLIIIPRKEQDGNVISASSVRKMIQEDHIDDMRDRVPETTYRFFKSDEAKDIVYKLQHTENVVHY